MNKIDYLNIDGSTLKTFITVLEKESVSKAAIRLNVTQSAVSHTIDKYAQSKTTNVRSGSILLFQPYFLEVRFVVNWCIEKEILNAVYIKQA